MAKAGRPSFKPTATQRRSVEQMVSVGESHLTIARALGIDDDTLRKHFRTELDFGLAKRRQEAVEILFKAARKGNVSAAKRIEEMTRIAGAAAAIEVRAEPATPKPETIGKKAATKAAAEGITGKYATPAAPKLVVNNE